MVLKKNTVKKDALGWQIIQQLHVFKYLYNIRIDSLWWKQSELVL